MYKYCIFYLEVDQKVCSQTVVSHSNASQTHSSMIYLFPRRNLKLWSLLPCLPLIGNIQTALWDHRTHKEDLNLEHLKDDITCFVVLYLFLVRFFKNWVFLPFKTSYHSGSISQTFSIHKPLQATIEHQF